MPEREDLRKQVDDNLSKGSNFYWDSQVPSENIAGLAEKYSVGAFNLPRWETHNGHVEAVIP